MVHAASPVDLPCDRQIIERCCSQAPIYLEMDRMARLQDLLNMVGISDVDVVLFDQSQQV